MIYKILEWTLRGFMFCAPWVAVWLAKPEGISDLRWGMAAVIMLVWMEQRFWRKGIFDVDPTK